MRLINADALDKMCDSSEYHEVVTSWLDLAPTVFELPDNATNGDIIKAIFPDMKFKNAMPFTDDRWEIINLDTENIVSDKSTQLRVYADWWNTPYERR